MSPRVSVVVAARDATATLAETLASIRAQTYRDCEVVLVDDGSTDGTAELARALLPEVRVVRHEVATGPAGARNHGAREARGELLAMLDADDAWLPEYLERQVARLDATAAAAVCCDAHVRRGDGPLEPPTFAGRVGLADPITLSSLLRTNTVFTSVVMVRAVFLGLGGYAEDLVHGEDFDLWLRMTAAGHAIAVNREPLAVYRLRADGLTADTLRISRSTREVYRRALARGGLTRGQRRIARRQARLHGLNAARAAPPASAAGRAALLARSALVAAEHPERWRGWLRAGPRPAGPGRHA
jgi:glycosyltransferase involved in cell wall biosynthesis